jgi:hypothetical protein
MTDAPACPECSQPMKSGGFVLSGREDAAGRRGEADEIGQSVG